MKNHSKIVVISLMTILSICAQCSAQENSSSCVCGRPGEEDCDINKIYTRLHMQVSTQMANFPPNHQFCYKYRLLGLDCKTAEPEVLPGPSIDRKIVSAGGASHFPILTPNYYTSQCYNPSEYCIARASCSDNEVLVLNPELSDSTLTFNEESASTECTDRMQFFDGSIVDPLGTSLPLGASFCGEDVGSNMKYDQLPNNDFELHFYSSLCCQNCGSYIWMTCADEGMALRVKAMRSLSSSAEQRIFDKLFINVWNRKMLYWVRKTLLIPDGSSVRLKHSNVIITSKNAPVNIYSGIRKLFVFDEKTKHYYLFWQESHKVFNISGVLYIGYHKAWFVATEQESPIERRTTRETAFVRRAVEFLKPFYGTPPTSEVPLGFFPEPIDPMRKPEYKPKCTRYNDRISKKCPTRQCPSPGVQSANYIESKHQLKVSTDFFVRTFASLIIKTLTSEKPIGVPITADTYEYLAKYRYPSYGGYPKGPRPGTKQRLNCPVLVHYYN